MPADGRAERARRVELRQARVALVDRRDVVRLLLPREVEVLLLVELREEPLCLGGEPVDLAFVEAARAMGVRRIRAVREIVLETERKLQLIEVTDAVRDARRRRGRRDCRARLRAAHDGGRGDQRAIDPELVTDLENAFQRVVGDDWEWTHEDEDGPNAPSHARASLASSPQVLIPLSRRRARARHVPGHLLLRVRRAAHAQDLRDDAHVDFHLVLRQRP